MNKIKAFVDNEVCITLILLMPVMLFVAIFTDSLKTLLIYTGIVLVLFGILRLALYLVFCSIVKALIYLKEKKGVWIKFRLPVIICKVKPIR